MPMNSHFFDRDDTHTHCGKLIRELPPEEREIGAVLPLCDECKAAISDTLYVRNYLQAYWETQMGTSQ